MLKLEELLRSNNREDIMLGIILFCKDHSTEEILKKFPRKPDLYPVNLEHKPIDVESKDYIIFAASYIEAIDKRELDHYFNYRRSFKTEIYEL